MEQFLASGVFRYVLFPLGSAVLGVYVKWVTRNDEYARFRKEDIAVGLDLIVAACLMRVMLTTDRALDLVGANRQLEEAIKALPMDAQKVVESQERVQALSSQLMPAGFGIALMFLALWSGSTFVRKWGWESATEMRPFRGIAIPLVFGILAFILVMAGSAQ